MRPFVRAVLAAQGDDEVVARSGARDVVESDPLGRAARLANVFIPLVIANAPEVLGDSELEAVQVDDSNRGGGVVDVVRHRGEDNDRKLQALRLVNGHETDRIVVANIGLREGGST